MRVKHPRLASLILLLIFSAAVGGYLWWGRMHFFHGAWAAAAYGLAVGTAILGHIVFQDSRFQLGWRLDNLRPAGIRFGTFTVVSGAVVACAGWFSGRTPRLGSDALIYLVWAALQQYFLQDFLLQRAATVCFGEVDGRSGGRVSKRSSMEVSIRERTSWSERWCPPVLAAAVFGLLHLPNYALAALTFSAGVVWCRLFRSTPSLPAVWLSHAVLALVLIAFFKGDPLFHQFQVGRPGYRFVAYGDGIQVAAGWDGGGRAFIATLPGPRPRRPAEVRVFDCNGSPLAVWTAFPGLGFSGRMVVGDVAPEPGDEVVVTPGPGAANPPRVRVFSPQGHLLHDFSADALPAGYGAFVAAVAGRICVAAGPGPGDPPVWAEYTADGRLMDQGEAPVDQILVNGIRMLRLPPGGGEFEGVRRVFWGSPIAVNPAAFLVVETEGTTAVKRTWKMAFPATYGLSLTPVRLSREESGLAASLGPLLGYPRWVRIFADRAGWPMVRQFALDDGQPSAGLSLAALDVDGDGRDELVLGEGEGPGCRPVVRIVRLDGTLLIEWEVG
jgi:hypothetical protein